MPFALFDTSVYISALRRSDPSLMDLSRFAIQAPLWISVVVLEELYAGTDNRDRHVIERLEKDFEQIHRILVPILSDWVQAGRLLARIATKYGYEEIGRGRLTNDALIAVSAGRMGALVITENKRDFTRLSEFHNFSWRLPEF
jgi:predicted nucleic acid-binding protein